MAGLIIGCCWLAWVIFTLLFFAGAKKNDTPGF